MGTIVTGTVKDVTIGDCSTGRSFGIRMKANSHDTNSGQKKTQKNTGLDNVLRRNLV